MEAISWFIIFVVLVGFEIVTLGLTTIWFAIGALAAFILAAVGAPLIAQVIVFIVVSIITLCITRPIAVKYINNKTTKTNVDEMAGKTAKVVEKIDNINATGQISVDGVIWTARSEGGEVIEVDEIVTVIGIEGVKAIVK